uniref:Retrotransposon gag domain-containing protein n=1 Tax=Chenopodium quinoa TaxID=63459 RepID=A0A803L9Q7_CHEQI
MRDMPGDEEQPRNFGNEIDYLSDNVNKLSASVGKILERFDGLDTRMEQVNISVGELRRSGSDDNGGRVRRNFNHIHGEQENNRRREDEIKLTDLPEFDGSADPECKDLDDQRRFKYATLKLSRYASLWYESMKRARDKEGKEKLQSWTKLKKKLRMRFVPKTYKQDLFRQLDTLQQGGLSIEQYTKKFDNLSLACDIEEGEEQRMSRFLRGLNIDIANVVELQQFWTYDELSSLALKIEKQLRGTKVRSYTKALTPNKVEGVGSSSKGISTTTKSEFWDKNNQENKGENSRNSKNEGKKSTVKCFKCQGVGHYAKRGV